ncbi:MAG: hypothetical protein J0I83_06390 [Nitrobacter sp.]|nr:hypothetical protein [Nitrobacter sp.]
MTMMSMVVMMSMMPVVVMSGMVPMAGLMPMAMMPPMGMGMMPPLHLCGQLAGVALLGRGDTRTDRRCRLRLLRGSRRNQKRAKSGKP